MARTGKTDPVSVCIDADVLIAGLLSRTGASHAILILGEIGLLTLVLPEAYTAQVTIGALDRLLALDLDPSPPFFMVVQGGLARLHTWRQARKRQLRWQAGVASAPQVLAGAGVATTLSRLKHGFESRWSHQET